MGWPWQASITAFLPALLIAAPQAPLPQPKPIVVAPLPVPGQHGARPAPARKEPEAKPSPSARQEPKPAAEAAPSLAGRAKAPADYGSTPVPWTPGSSDPNQFPAGIPRVPGAQRAAYSMSVQTASAYFLCWAPPAEVAKLYLDFVEREKWELVPIPGPPPRDERMVIARKGDWSLRVDIGPHPLSGGTEVFVSASLKMLPPKPRGNAGKGKP